MATTASSARTMAPNTITFPSRVRDIQPPSESYTQPNSENNNNNNNYNNHVRARVREIEQIHDAYEDVLGRSMPRFVEREVLGMIADGVEPSMIRDVIEYTACAPRPSWAYARAVIYRNHEKGISSSGAFARSLAERGRDGDDLPY